MYSLDNSKVYRTKYEGNTEIKELLGDVNAVKVERIDNQKVADVSYTFDFNQNKYVETGRVERNDPLPPNDIDLLKAQNAEIIFALVMNDLM